MRVAQFFGAGLRLQAVRYDEAELDILGHAPLRFAPPTRGGAVLRQFERFGKSFALMLRR